MMIIEKAARPGAAKQPVTPLGGGIRRIAN